jgi:hypothetical protein
MAASAVEAGGDDDAGGRRTRLGLSALPHLNGRRGRIVRAFYLVLAAATLVVVAGGIWFNGVDAFVNAPAASRFGFRTVTVETGAAPVAAVAPTAMAAGLRSGDRILAVDGNPVRDGASEFEVGRLLSAAPGPVLDLGVRGETGEVRNLRLEERAGVWGRRDPYSGLPLWLYSILAVVMQPQLILLIASLLLYRRRPNDPETMLFAFSLLLLNWNEAALWWLTVVELPAERIGDLGTFGWIAIFIAVAGFPDGRFASSWSRWTVAGALPVLLALLIAAIFALRDPVTNGLINGAYLLLTVAAAISVLLRYRRTAPGMERQQIKWAVGGFCISAVTILIMFPAYLAGLLDNDGSPLIYLAGTLAVMVAYAALPAGLLISLLRFRLYDADAAISRSAGYAVLTLLLGATFAATAKGMEVFFETSFGREAGAWPGAIGAGLAVVLITPMHNRIHGWAERRFQKALLHLKRDLPDCVGDLRETAGMQELLDEVLARVEAGTRAVRSAVVIDGRTVATRGEDGEDFPISMPLRIDHQKAEIGTLLVGPRPDGSPPGKDEREALDEIADPVARAVRIVRLRESREAEERSWRRALETRLGALEAGE